jgi:hypothetical protein
MFTQKFTETMDAQRMNSVIKVVKYFEMEVYKKFRGWSAPATQSSVNPHILAHIQFISWHVFRAGIQGTKIRDPQKPIKTDQLRWFSPVDFLKHSNSVPFNSFQAFQFMMHRYHS